MGDRQFKSIDHPGGHTWPAVYGRALVRPVAACMLPVMVLTLVAILEGVRVMPDFLGAAAGAVAVASLWTSFRLRSRVVEIHIQDSFANVLTPWDLLRGRTSEWMQILDVRDYGSWMHATIGLSSYELERLDWPEYEEMVRVLKAASVLE